MKMDMMRTLSASKGCRQFFLFFFRSCTTIADSFCLCAKQRGFPAAQAAA